ILVLCVARPELLDDRPAWAGGKLNATSLLLEPLSEGECVILIENLLDRAPLAPNVRASITRAAEGNPLFVEEMVAMLIDDRLLHREDGHWTAADDLAQISVPPTIHALLAARLDRLKHEERQVIECASVIGQVFYRSAVFELSKETLRARVAGDLMALVRKELIRPDRSDFSGEDAFRFRHILVRDTAYDSLPKEARATLHESFANWLEKAVGERITEYEEIAAYHLEQSFRYRSELGPSDERAAGLRKRAGTRLAAAGTRALDRSDISAALNLLERAESMLQEEDEQRVEVLLELGRALFWAGQLTRAMDVLNSAVEAARARGDSTLEWRARVQRSHLELATQTSAAITEHVRTEIEQAIAVFESHADTSALAEAWLTMAMVCNMQGEMEALHEAARRALAYAQGAGNRRLEREAYAPLGAALVNGPIPVRQGIEEMEVQLATQTDPRMQTYTLLNLAQLRALNGELDEARALQERASRGFEELGMRFSMAIAMWSRGSIEGLDRQWTAAESYLRDAYTRFTEMGDKSWLSTLAVELGQIVYELGDPDEALRLTQVSEDLASPDDIVSQMMWRCLRAKVVARRGEMQEAEALATDSVSLAATVDMPVGRGQALMDLAEVLHSGGRVDEASHAAHEALLVYEAKGIVPQVAHARAVLAAMTP
ncbi:MAG: tetratricopeptide repeat protein, partial [Actinomycetota bacterium]|nr:tetratricopeptide repeat protein [Actinomycetota bacterium]